jgi:hypothetical protein
MRVIEETKWIIISKDRRFIAKGVPRNRWLVPIDEKTNDRILLYSTEKKAKDAFMSNWFFTTDESKHLKPEDLEAVKVQITYEAIFDYIHLSKPMNEIFKEAMEGYEGLFGEKVKIK